MSILFQQINPAQVVAACALSSVSAQVFKKIALRILEVEECEPAAR